MKCIPTDTDEDVTAAKLVPNNCAESDFRFVTNVPVLTELDSCVEYALDGYCEFVTILYDAKIVEELEDDDCRNLRELVAPDTTRFCT